MPEPVLVIGALAGYAAVYSAAQGGSAVSTEARAIRKSASAVIETAEQSHALFGAKSGAISKIWELTGECAEPGWDGNEARPVDRLAAKIAVEFIRVWPEIVPLPEFAPEPDGSISFDWIQSRTRLFSLSVGVTNRLAYAWLDGADKGHGVARFDGSRIPQRVLEGILSIVNNGNPSHRAA